MKNIFEIIDNENTFEVLINNYDEVIYKKGREEFKDSKIFKNEIEYNSFIDKLLADANKTRTKNNYYYSFIRNEAHVNIILPPMSCNGPSITILRTPTSFETFDEYQNLKAIDDQSKKVLQKILEERASILVAGHHGSGKSTLINLLMNTLDKDLRVVTIEKTPQLKSNRKNYIRLICPSNKAEELSELIEISKNLLADYIIYPELPGLEAMDIIENTSEGSPSMLLLHGENIYDSLKNLESKALNSNFSNSADDVKYSIAQAFDYIVYQEKIEKNLRAVTKIAKINYDNYKLHLELIYNRAVSSEQ